jgi:UPF0755 protein
MGRKSGKQIRLGNVGSLSVKALLLVLVLLVFLLSGSVWLFFGEEGGADKMVIIPRGTSLSHVAEILYENGVIQHPQVFRLVLRFTQGNSRVRAGEFHFTENMRPLSVLHVLYFEQPVVHNVTIPEGWNVHQIAQILAAEKLVDPDKFIKIALSGETAKKMKLPSPNLEGFLYPDTYAFSRIDGEEKVIERMVQRFSQVYDKEIKTEADKQGMDKLRLVTLASIIEKETGVDEERPLVSSVFHNRIKKKMRLQSDPTTIYGIPNFNGNLTRANLHTYSPYNTYVIPGLPPGPIASPGLASMKAVLFPADTKYLYFVANGKGHHLFSENYEQHARKVNAYQKK